MPSSSSQPETEVLVRPGVPALTETIKAGFKSALLRFLPFSGLMIRTRLALGLGLLTVFMVLLIFLGSVSLYRIKNKMDYILRVSNAKVWHANAIRDSIHGLEKSLLTIALSPEENVRSMEYVKVITVQAVYRYSLGELAKLEDQRAGRELIERVRRGVQDCEDLTTRFFEFGAQTAGRPDRVRKEMEKVRAPVQNVLQVCSELVSYEKDQSDRLNSEAESTYAYTRNLSFGIGGFFILIAVILTIFLTRSITRPLEEGIRIADQLAQGNLGVQIQIRRRDETGHLLSAMKNMLEKLKQVRSLQDQLFQSQKLETIGRLAGGVAHDFNNILAIIGTHAQLCLMDLREGQKHWDNFKEMDDAVKRAAALVKQLLAFSSNQPMDIRPLNLNLIVKDMQKMLRRLIGEDIALEISPAPDLGQAKADLVQMEQVLLNLAVNARDAMPFGGKLIIETKNLDLDAGYADLHFGVSPGRYVLLSVNDTGVGMPAEVRKRIFEPFFTTKGKGKGTGLGLSTVYGIVRQCNGHIEVYSEPGKGANFKIYLPRIDETTMESPEKIKKAVLPGGGETVLLVEDEDRVRRLVLTLLQQKGYSVLDAASPGAALRAIENYQGPLHLMITDVILPEINGFELSERVKTFFPEIKIIFMSGYIDQGIVPPEKMKTCDFISKPFNVDQFMRRVREALDRA